jgi:peptidyl-prolyl cis-trans isomerase D
MLQTIRDKFTGVIAFLVIGAIGVTLVISFGSMSMDAVGGGFAAEVNGEPIPLTEYQRVMQSQLVRQQEAFQGELPPALQEQLQRNVLENLVRNEVVKQYVRESGYRVDDERVRQAIRTEPAFQVAGRYSSDSYVAVLNSQGLVPELYEQDQRSSLTVAQLQNGVVGSAFYTPAEYRRYIQLLTEERRVATISFDPAALIGEVPVTDEVLQADFDKNPEQYMLEESVTLDYVEVLLADISADIVLEDADLRDYYELNAQRYAELEQRQVSHILIIAEGEETADIAAQQVADLSSKIVAGENFEDLAREFSNDTVSAEDGGSLGWAGRGDYPEPFEEALFALEKGQVSEPVRTEFGYHLIRLDDVRAGSQQPFEEVREELSEELRRQKAADRYYAIADSVDDLALENAGSLDEVAAESGLEVKRLDVFTRSGGDPLGYSAALVDAAFSVAVLEDRENSPLIELADDRAVVIRVVDYRPTTLRPFAEVRAEVESAYRLKQAAELAQSRGQAMLAGLQAGDDLAALAAQYSMDAPAAVLLGRGANDISPEVLAAVFRAPKPAEGVAVSEGVALSSGGYAVFRLEEVIPGRPELIPQQQRDERKAQLAQQDGGLAATAVIAELRNSADVVVLQGLFDQPERL